VSEATPPPSDSTPQPYRLDARVELTKPSESPKGIDWLAWLQASTPIVVAAVGLYFTDAVRTGFERQQLQLANAAGMQMLLGQLLGANTTDTEAKVAASTLATFGAPAVAPLVTALIGADDVRTPAIESALSAMGLTGGDEVCGRLISLLEHRTGRYQLPAIRAAIRVIGDVRCPGARTLLETYRKALIDGSLIVFELGANDWKPLPANQVDELKADVDRALREVK
jgi:hypothetical protein